MESLFLNVLNNALTVSYLIVAVILVRLFLKKSPKWVSCILWAIVAIRLICPFTIQSALSLIPSAEPVKQEIGNMAYVRVDTGLSSVDAVVNPALIAQEIREQEAGMSASSVQVMLLGFAHVWALGVVALLLYAGGSYFVLKRRVRRAIMVEGDVYEHASVSSPFILGFIRPRIYLPVGLDATVRGCVLSHERAHIKRFDHVWKPAGFMLLAIYWFNPLCLIAYILLCKDIELACDEKATSNRSEAFRVDYCQALLDLSVSRRMITACPVAFGEIGVKDRVKSVLNYKKPAFWIIIVSILTCSAVGIFFATSPKKEDVSTQTAEVTETADAQPAEAAESIQAEDVQLTESAETAETVEAAETATEEPDSSEQVATEDQIKDVSEWADNFFANNIKSFLGMTDNENFVTDYKILSVGEDTAQIAYCAMGKDEAENVIVGEMEIKKGTYEPGEEGTVSSVPIAQMENGDMVFVESEAPNGESQTSEVYVVKAGVCEAGETYTVKTRVDSEVYVAEKEDGTSYVKLVAVDEENQTETVRHIICDASMGDYYLTSFTSSSAEFFDDAEFFTKWNVEAMNQAFAAALTNGIGEALNEKAKTEKDDRYKLLFDATTAAKAFLNEKQDGLIVTDIFVEEVDGENIATLKLQKYAMHFQLRMRQPWGEDGIWVPEQIEKYDLSE